MINKYLEKLDEQYQILRKDIEEKYTKAIADNGGKSNNNINEDLKNETVGKLVDLANSSRDHVDNLLEKQPTE